MSQAEITLAEPITPPRRGLAGFKPQATVVTAGALIGLAAVSAALRFVLARQVSSPFVFMDELGYERMAQSFARTGHFSLFGHGGLALSPLYPIVISPIYRLTSSASNAFELVKALNVVIFSLAIFPIYGIARSVLTRPRAVGVCALSSLLPLVLYANVEMSESISYLLFLTAIWSMLRTIRCPGAVNDALLFVAVALASAARLQNVALLPAALTAVVLVPLARPPADESRTRSVAAAIRRHRLLYSGSTALLVLVLVKRATNGGSLPLAGTYAKVGTAHVSPLRVLELAFQHFVELDLALGVIPFAGALLAGYALARFRFPTRQLAFGAAVVSVTAWLITEVAYAAAAYDVGTSSATAPRIHERYLIYLEPLFLIAFVAALRAVRPRISGRAHVLVAAAAAVLPATIPFGHVVNFTVPIDTFGLEILARTVRGVTGPTPHAAVVALAVGGFLGLTYLYAVLRPVPSFAVVMTVFALLLLSLIVQLVMVGNTRLIERRVPTHGAWVDAAAGGRPVTLVGGSRRHSSTLLLEAFWNLSVTRVYWTCVDVFGTVYGERRLTPSQGGLLLHDGAKVQAEYVLAPISLGLRGRVVRRQRSEGLELVAPRGGVLRIERPLRCRV